MDICQQLFHVEKVLPIRWRCVEADPQHGEDSDDGQQADDEPLVSG